MGLKQEDSLERLLCPQNPDIRKILKSFGERHPGEERQGEEMEIYSYFLISLLLISRDQFQPTIQNKMTLKIWKDQNQYTWCNKEFNSACIREGVRTWLQAS